MNTLHRDVIIDLLPIYLAGDASEATQALIKARLATDAKLAQIVATLDNDATLSPALSIPATIETAALTKTKQRLKWQRTLFGLSIFLTLFVFSFRFDSSGIDWLWQDRPQIAILCTGLAAITWFGYAKLGQQLKID